MTPVFRAGIAGIRFLSDLPIAADRERNVLDRTAVQVGQRDDDDLAAGFRVDVGDDSLDRRRGVRGNDVRKVVDVPHGRRDLNPLKRQHRRQRVLDETGRAKRHATQPNSTVTETNVRAIDESVDQPGRELRELLGDRLGLAHQIAAAERQHRGDGDPENGRHERGREADRNGRLDRHPRRPRAATLARPTAYRARRA